MCQTEEEISGGRGDGAEVSAETVCKGLTARHPTGRGEVAVLLQGVSVGGRVGPDNFHAVRSIENDEQIRHAGHLHHINYGPIAAGDGIIAIAHRPLASGWPMVQLTE